jgi:hypothetical protein
LGGFWFSRKKFFVGIKNRFLGISLNLNDNKNLSLHLIFIFICGMRKLVSRFFYAGGILNYAVKF